MLTSIRWGRGETAGHRRQTPFLYVRLNEDKTALPEVDMNRAGAVRADCRKEILGLEAMGYVVELFAVAGEEDCARTRSVPDTYDISLYVLRTVICRSKGLVVAALAGGCVRY